MLIYFNFCDVITSLVPYSMWLLCAGSVHGISVSRHVVSRMHRNFLSGIFHTHTRTRERHNLSSFFFSHLLCSTGTATAKNIPFLIFEYSNARCKKYEREWMIIILHWISYDACGNACTLHPNEYYLLLFICPMCSAVHIQSIKWNY